jgi:pyruvate dehydrogenase E2 component (dihydrolipoamide acetyltransferase)
VAHGFTKERELSSWRKLSLHTWGRPSDPSIYGILELDATRANDYVRRAREAGGVHVTLTHLIGKAVALAIAEHPEVNAIVRRGRGIYLRESVDVFFQVAFDGGEDLSGAKVSGADGKSVPEIALELAARAERIRAHADRSLQRTQALLERLPSPLRAAALRLAELATYDLGLDLRSFGVPYDQFGSAMVTNIASFGLPMGFAPLVPFSRVPILLTVGRVSDAPLAVDGAVDVRPVLRIGVTLDHRIIDGFEAGRLAQRFLAVMANPIAALGAPAERPGPRPNGPRANGPGRQR